jgi:hypothetical protein
MTDILDRPSSTESTAVPPAPCRAGAPDGELTPLAFRLELQTTHALLTVLATVARLGGRIAVVRAAEAQAVIGVLALPQTVHRVQRALAQLVEVLAVAAIEWPGVDET